MAFTNRNFSTVTSVRAKRRTATALASKSCEYAVLARLPDYYLARRTKSAAGLHTGKANGYERDDQAHFEDRISDWIDSGCRGMWAPEVRVSHRGGIGRSDSGIGGRRGSRQSGAVEEIFRGRCYLF